MIILIHTSKTMRPPAQKSSQSQTPELIYMAKTLAEYLKSIKKSDLIQVMHLSQKLADKTCELITSWTDLEKFQRTAIDSFLGDIYSGLQVQDWSKKDLDYSNKSLRIISGLYGILRPLDGIYPYRLEMGYKLPDEKFSNLYSYWSDQIANTLPSDETIINLAAKEYSKVVTDFIDSSRIISPVFLTQDKDSNTPKFIVVHAKIARGAFARWLIKNRINEIRDLRNFNELGYEYSHQLSYNNSPTFVCKSFKGLGLSVRLK